MNKKELEVNRNYLVAKRNDLIQKSRYSLNAMEHKIIWYLVSKIDPDDDHFKIYYLNLKEFCKICGIQEGNGKNYQNLKDTIQKLKGKGFWSWITPSKEVLIEWIEKPVIDHDAGVIELKLDENMMPYLLKLKESKCYTLCEFSVMLSMQGRYSIRLYEILKSVENFGTYKLKLDNLKWKLNAENYTRFPDFKKRVIDLAMEEINKFADFNVEVEFIKTGKKYTDACFVFTAKNAIEHYDTIKNIESKLEVSNG